MKKLLLFLAIISLKSFGQASKLEITSTTSENVTGIKATLKNTAPVDYQAAIYGINLSNNNMGIAITGTHNGSGVGVYGITMISGIGVLGTSISGTGVRGFSNAGIGGTFDTYGTVGLVSMKNVGIKTISPAYPLSFKDEIGDKISLFGGETNTTTNHYGMGIQSAQFQLFTPTTNDDIVFGIGRSAAFTENVRLKGNGKVGIGLNNPNELLDVNGRMRIRHNGSSSGVWFSNSTNSLNEGDGSFYGMKTNTETGIFIAGAWRFWVNNLGNGYLNGNLIQTSDKRLKKDFQPLSNSLSKLTALQGYHFKWIEEARSKELQTGLLAQEVQKIFPELVQTDEKGYLSVNYIGLVPHLVEAVKDQQNEIETMRKENALLKENNLALYKRLAIIEAAIFSKNNVAEESKSDKK